MEIIVVGNSKMEVTPDVIKLNLTFKEHSDTYKEVLTKGTNKVMRFINKILIPNNFNEKDLKTSTFKITENKVYKESTNSYEIEGYLFEQHASIEFKYDKIKLAKIMEEITILDVNINYTINFTIGNKQANRDIMLKRAYNDAYNQALSICSAAEKELIECRSCERISYDNMYLSNSFYDSQLFSKSSLNEVITTSFTPEDIVLEETVKCTFIC